MASPENLALVESAWNDLPDAVKSRLEKYGKRVVNGIKEEAAMQIIVYAPSKERYGTIARDRVKALSAAEFLKNEGERSGYFKLILESMRQDLVKDRR